MTKNVYVFLRFVLIIVIRSPYRTRKTSLQDEGLRTILIPEDNCIRNFKSSTENRFT